MLTMNEQLINLAGILIALVLVGDSLLHVYWAMGHIWPAPNQLSLSQAVLNSNKTDLFKPPTLVPLAGLLLLGALTVLARIHLLGRLGQLIPELWLQIATWVIAAGFLLIGLTGIVRAVGLLEAKSKLYYKLNLLLYMPLCLVLFAAAVVVARY
jgi:hypothetical protein